MAIINTRQPGEIDEKTYRDKQTSLVERNQYPVGWHFKKEFYRRPAKGSSGKKMGLRAPTGRVVFTRKKKNGCALSSSREIRQSINKTVKIGTVYGCAKAFPPIKIG